MTYTAGQHWFICDVCGFKFLSTEKRKRWDGLIVCPSDWETDHPQKFIRVEADGQAVPDPRPRPEGTFVEICTVFTKTPAAGIGIVGCATVGAVLNIKYTDYGYPAVSE